MMESREYLNSLFDIYKELLTITEQVAFSEHFVEDLSMQEIADIKNISKSSVGKTVQRASEKLERYEGILHIYKAKKMLEEALEQDNINDIKEKIKDVLEIGN